MRRRQIGGHADDDLGAVLLTARRGRQEDRDERELDGAPSSHCGLGDVYGEVGDGEAGAAGHDLEFAEDVG